MEKISFGKTEIKTTPIGVGTMPWSNSKMWGYGSKLGPEAAGAAFQASLEAGVDFFDTAEIYGWGQSERILGKLLGSTEQPVYVATKYAPLPWRFTRSQVRRALEKSLERLGLEYVDLYQVHFPGGLIKIEALMDALADVVEAGLTRYIGVSNYNLEQMQRAQAALAKRGVALVSNQVEYSLVQQSPRASGLLEVCQEMGITLIAYSPLGRGALTGKYRPGSPPKDARRFYGHFKQERLEALLPLLEAMDQIGHAHGGKSAAQVALNWLARQPNVFPIPGAKNARQARENAAAIDWTMSAEEAQRLDELSAPFRGVG
jgi:aryl-alcohol dehydrogenase-like predicted oxidoreductase